MAGPKNPLVLIADDDPDVLRVMRYHLEGWGCRTASAEQKSELQKLLSQEVPTLLLLDIRFGEHDGVEILQDLLRQFPDLFVVMMTAFGSINSAVTAIKLGARDYLTKPPDLNRLKAMLQDAGTAAEKAREASGASSHSTGSSKKKPGSPVRMLGESDAINRIRAMIAGVAPTEATVLILGESGTGKEVVARAIHDQSRRKSGPFVALNMAAMPRELVESTLFGHEKGAFTGADQPQEGLVEAADQGTLFLDEIGEMDISLQAKLLRFLQERTFQRVGSSKLKSVDVRIISATNREPMEQVRKGQLREDLYYRLNVVPIVMPPLRERADDVAILARHFLTIAAARNHKDVRDFRPEALSVLSGYAWPGNVRQLENLVERLVIFTQGAEIGVEMIPADIAGGPTPGPAFRAQIGPGRGQASSSLVFEAGPTTIPPRFSGDLSAVDSDSSDTSLRPIDQIEKNAILQALQQSEGNVREAARILGLGQATVYRKIKRYGIKLD